MNSLMLRNMVLELFNKFKTLPVEIFKSFEHPDKEMREKPVFQLPCGGRDIEHNFDSLNAVKIVEIIRVS